MISLLIVNYRSAELAIEAIRTARCASSSPLEVIVVDNSCDAREADALRGHADVVIASTTNRGYAGAINDGRRACSGDVLIACNPDVTFAPKSIDALVAPFADADVAVAGPALYWDDALVWMLPPSELHTAREKIGEVLASRSRKYAASRDRARIRKRIAFWSNTATRDVDAISGAIIAIRTSVFDDLGGFDERFQLYFEENDFLRRVAQRRKRVVYVPSAKCRHIYNQSAAQSESSAALYAESEMRYLAKWNGPFVARTLKRWERERGAIDEAKSGAINIERANTLVEASPLANFETAAGVFCAQEVACDVPPEVRVSYRGGTLYLRVIDRATTRVLATYKMTT